MCARVSYIVCDPILACITVIPVLLLHRLPILVEDFLCLERPVVDISLHNDTCVNRSFTAVTLSLADLQNLTVDERVTLQDRLVSCRILSSVVCINCVTLYNSVS